MRLIGGYSDDENESNLNDNRNSDKNDDRNPDQNDENDDIDRYIDPTYRRADYSYRNYGVPFQHVPLPTPKEEPIFDQEVIDQMREAGLSESQIQEQIDYHVAQR